MKGVVKLDWHKVQCIKAGGKNILFTESMGFCIIEMLKVLNVKLILNLKGRSFLIECLISSKRDCWK